MEALSLAVTAAEVETTPETFDRIHATLLHGDPGAGQVRQVQNWIGGSDFSPRNARYIPPPWEDVPELLADLATFMNRVDLPALPQAALAHAHFECIHPYDDGNGRTGRALVHLLLRKRGVVHRGIAPISLALLADRQRYFDLLASYQAGTVEDWVLHFVHACARAAQLGSTLAGRLADLGREWNRSPMVAGARADAVLRRIVADLTARPVIDASHVATRHGVSERRARAALNELEQAGILRSSTVARGRRVWKAWEVLAALDDLEQSAGDPINR